MSTDTQPVAAETCAPEPHAWSHHHHGGPIYIGICYLCGQIDWDSIRQDIAKLTDVAIATELNRWRGILTDLTDPDPCWFDHHGGCQAHGFLSLQPGEKCPQALAKELLAHPAAS